jgi:hypothetical protein
VWLGRILLSSRGSFAQASPRVEGRVRTSSRRGSLGVPVGRWARLTRQVMSGDIANGLSLLETEVATACCPTKWLSAGKGVVSAWLGEGINMTAWPACPKRSDAAPAWTSRCSARSISAGMRRWTLAAAGRYSDARAPADAVGAEKLYRQALALAEDLGMRPLAARCCLGLGRLYLLLDKRSPAQGHLATARAMLAQMGIRLLARGSRGGLCRRLV